MEQPGRIESAAASPSLRFPGVRKCGAMRTRPAPLLSLLTSLPLLAGLACSPAAPPGGPSPGQASGQTPGQTAGQQLRLVLNWVPEPEFGGFYAAEVDGGYARHGLAVTVQPGGPGTPTLDMVAAGRAELGVASADELILGRARGMDVVALFAVYQTNPQAIMVHAASGIDSLAALFSAAPGRRVTLALSQGLPYVRFLERKYGFDHVRVVPFAGGVAQFLADPDLAQQCFVSSEPLAARRQGEEPRVLLVADAGYDPYTTVVVARRAFVDGAPEVARKLVEALRAGWAVYLADPAPANRRMQELNPTLDAETFTAAAAAQQPLIETAETRARGLGTMTDERWAETIDQLVDLGMVERAQAPRPEACFLDLAAAGAER